MPAAARFGCACCVDEARAGSRVRWCVFSRAACVLIAERGGCARAWSRRELVLGAEKGGGRGREGGGGADCAACERAGANDFAALDIGCAFWGARRPRGRDRSAAAVLSARRRRGAARQARALHLTAVWLGAAHRAGRRGRRHAIDAGRPCAQGQAAATGAARGLAAPPPHAGRGDAEEFLAAPSSCPSSATAE